MRIEIPGLPPSACSPNARVHWAVKARSANSWGSTVFYCAVDARNRTGEPSRWKDLDGARVAVTFVLTNKRRRDLDNLIASFKSGLDALVRCGILVDDSAGHVTLTYAAKQGDDAQTIVEITPCEDK
jgi:crossover junction endodeoxyribonuclease RusA